MTASASSVVGVAALSKSFGAIAALKNVSLDLAAGEVRAICGENGAGKSTLVKILTGVYRPDSGSVTIGGEPVEIETPRRAQELGIAFVAQELSLCPDLSVEDTPRPIAPPVRETLAARYEVRDAGSVSSGGVTLRLAELTRRAKGAR